MLVQPKFPSSRATVGDETEQPDSLNRSGTSNANSGVSKPTITPPSGVFEVTLQVHISCTTPNAIIYYTTDGITPTAMSTVYTGPFTIIETTTIKAIAAKNTKSSEMATVTLSVEHGIQAEPPEINVLNPHGELPGIFPYSHITMFSVTPGSYFHYTLDGTTPTRSSTMATGDDIILTIETCIAKAFARSAGFVDSDVTTENITVTLPSVAIQPAPGTFVGATTVTLALSFTILTPYDGAEIWYTIDGSDPSDIDNRIVYTAPFILASSAIVRCLTVRENCVSSVIRDYEFTIT